MVGFAFRAEVPLETGFDTGCNDDDASVFPACHDTRSFLGGGEGTGASSMPKSVTDEALTCLGARISECPLERLCRKLMGFCSDRKDHILLIGGESEKLREKRRK